MYSVELYVKIRRAVMVEGRSEREVARYFGIHRKTVKKMCQYAAPPGYRRKKEPVSPKLAPFTGIIDAILEADKQVHAKQPVKPCSSRNRSSIRIALWRCLAWTCLSASNMASMMRVKGASLGETGSFLRR